MKHDLIKIDNCTICGCENHNNYISAIDHNVSQDRFQIVVCSDCGFNFTNPIPSESTIGRYYKSENYVSHSDTNKGLINKIYQVVRKRAIKNKENIIASYVKEKTLLDIGCGTGDFLAYCKNNNWETLGLEPDADARKIAKQKHNLEVEDLETLYDIESTSKDAITMWHVLEHVYHLNDDLTQYFEILKPGGFLFVAVPNISSYDAGYYKEHWAALDLPIHLYHFRPEDISNLCKKFQVNLVDILPMKYDSYYISMLSEKYRSGNLVNAFYRGFISNLKAKSNKNTYSSQIYVIQKPEN